MSVEDWFLTTAERGNPWTRLAYRHGGQSWTDGNEGRVLVHGVEYFARLRELIEAQQEGDLLLFTDWRGDPDEQIDDGMTVVELMTAAAARGVIVKGLFWRSHLDTVAYSEEENRSLANGIRAAGGEVILDMRVLPLGSHHQKLVVLRHRDDPSRDVAFVGGIDLCHTRRDDADHRGDPQRVNMGDVWGKTPAWHDMMIEVHGPAVGDVEATFRERWDDPTPPVLDPISLVQATLHHDDEKADPLPEQHPDPPEVGRARVQVLRTYPARKPRFPFAPEGERSVARAYDKAVRRAETLIYIEDQYFWNGEVTSCFAKALEQHPGAHMMVVLAGDTTAATRSSRMATMWSRNDALTALYEAGGDRVGVYWLENHVGTPIYVHSKFCVVDDVWMTVGSDNVNRRSWTYDSEITCAVLDEDRDEREPRTVRADGDEARRLPRETRLRLMREHLDLDDDTGIVDPVAAFHAFRESAARLDAWHAGGQAGPRPPGRLRRYVMPEVGRLERALGHVVYRYASDPDGRPLRMRGTNEF